MSFDTRQRANESAHLDVESEVLQGWILSQFRNGHNPPTTAVVKTQDGVPSCMNAVYIVGSNILELHDLLLFDNSRNVINEEDQEAGPTLIGVSNVDNPEKD